MNVLTVPTIDFPHFVQRHRHQFGYDPSQAQSPRLDHSITFFRVLELFDSVLRLHLFRYSNFEYHQNRKKSR